VPVHANLVEREREWSKFKLDATVVLTRGGPAPVGKLESSGWMVEK
jgi:hypothetical protein